MSETLGPNWGQQVREAQDGLRRKVIELREFLKMPRPAPGDEGAPAWAETLSQQLTAFHDEVCRRFRLEEEGGMVEDISRHHPRAATAAEQLAGEHPELVNDVRWLMKETLVYSTGGRPEDQALRRRTTELLDCLDEHERAETEMVHSLECDDVGGGE